MNGIRARLRYFVLDAVDEWRHSPGVNLLAAGTLGAVLFVAGLVLVVQSNLQRQLDDWQRNAKVDVYLEDGLDLSGRESLRRELASIEGVRQVLYVDKDEALRRLREWLSDDLAELAGTLDANPLPESLEVRLDDDVDPAEVAERISARFGGAPGVEEIRFDRDWLEGLRTWLAFVRVGGVAFAAVVLAAVAFVVASVLRLAVYARRDEIEIMLLVGASPSFVRGPFLVAGFLQGVAASCLALALVEAARRGLVAWAGSRVGPILPVLSAQPLGAVPSALLVAAGVAVSVVGSWLAVRGYMSSAGSGARES